MVSPSVGKLMRDSRGNGKYRRTDDTKIGIKKRNSYQCKLRNPQMRGTNKHTES
jgi:hypothetical protein